MVVLRDFGLLALVHACVLFVPTGSVCSCVDWSLTSICSPSSSLPNSVEVRTSTEGSLKRSFFCVSRVDTRLSLVVETFGHAAAHNTRNTYLRSGSMPSQLATRTFPNKCTDFEGR